jgi:DNA replication protein DnaC
MNTEHHMVERLRELKLSGLLETLEVRLRQARETELGHLDFLELILQDEIERRNARKLAQRLLRASFEEEKTIEGFDFSFNAKVNSFLIRDLARCSFIVREEHVLICGPAGTGKSHIAQALGHQACRLGYDVLFIKAVKLFRILYSARADHSWDQRIRRYLSPDLLIIDDFGLKSMNQTQAEDFYEIVSERHLKGSMIITSNRPVEDWLTLFPDPVMANSALDRLAHNAHHLIVEGESYRKRLSPANRAKE